MTGNMIMIPTTKQQEREVAKNQVRICYIQGQLVVNVFGVGVVEFSRLSRCFD